MPFKLCILLPIATIATIVTIVTIATVATDPRDHGAKVMRHGTWDDLTLPQFALKPYPYPSVIPLLPMPPPERSSIS